MMSKKARESEPNSKKSSQSQHRKSKRAHKSKKSKDPKMMSGSGRKGVIMAQCVPPGDIVTQPGTKIVLSAPYENNHTYHIEIVNSSARRIGWAIKTTNIKRIGVYPGCGVLDPKEAILMAVSCDAFAYRQEDAKNDRICIEWINTPDGAAKQFNWEWLQGDCVFRRKFLPIEYNP